MAAMKLLPMTEYGLSLVSGSYLARARVRVLLPGSDPKLLTYGPKTLYGCC